MSSDNPTLETATSDDELVDPRGEVTMDRHRMAPRLERLEGTTIGLLDNAKTNADVFLRAVGERLEAEYGVTETIYRQKSNTAIPADSIAGYLHEECDAVVNAYGDCGSCTSWCVYDSIDLEKRGTPVATVNSEEFVRLGQSESRSLGIPGLPLITVPHPMGDVSKEVVEQRAADALDDLVRALTTDRETLAAEFKGKYLDLNEELQDDDLYCPL